MIFLTATQVKTLNIGLSWFLIGVSLIGKYGGRDGFQTDIDLVDDSEIIRLEEPDDNLCQIFLRGYAARGDQLISTGNSEAGDHILVFFSLQYLPRVAPNDQLSPIIRHHQALPDKVNASIDDGILILVAHDVDQLCTHHLPLLDILYAASEEFVVTVGPEAERFDLPGFLVRVCNYPHDLFVLDVDHDQLPHHFDCYSINYHPLAVLGDDQVDDLHYFL